MKKVFKIFTIVILVGVVFIVILPIIFEDKIIHMVKKTINNNVNATFDFEEANLSLWSSFPNAEISLEKISLVNKAHFIGDTLFKAKSFELKMPFKDIFKNEAEGIRITEFVINEANFIIKIDKDGNTSYDITINKNLKKKEDANKLSSFQLGLESYKIVNSYVSYEDLSNKTMLQLNDFNHSGVGNLSSGKSELKTVSTALVSFQADSVAFLNKNKIQLEAILGIDLDKNIYSFLDNKALINQLPLIFNGYVKLNDNNKEVAISFKTPSSDFKNLLALIPTSYSNNIEGVTTTGNFDVEGTIDGIIDENHIPTFNIAINSDNASFKYPQLTKTLNNINIDAKIANGTGLAKDTYVLIDKLSFKIDDDVFYANAKLEEVSENMKVTANLEGTVNLENLEKIIPAEEIKGLKGILNINTTSSFDMRSIENDQYENTKTTGSFKISNFEYTSKELSNSLKVSRAALTFNPKSVSLNRFDAEIGKTDFMSTGTMSNLLGFIFNDENLNGNFILKSDTFSVNDFMISEVEKQGNEVIKASENHLKIPSFLDCTIDANATTVLYDNITLKNVSGRIIIKDQKAELKNMKSNVFDGTLGFNGSVSTKDSIPKFQMDLDVNNFNIGESFKSMDLFQAIAPIANAVDGKLNSNISLSGNLNADFTPDLNSLSGNVLAELLSSKITTEKTPLLQNLEQNLNFLDTKKLNLQNLKTALSFKDGKVTLKPFTLNYDDIEIDVSGSHGFDTSLSYDAVIKVPAKYLGKEASQLIAQLNDDELQNITVPISALISGKFSNPDIKTDLKSAIANLSKQVANKQKDKLVEKGKDEVSSVLENLLGGKKKEKDTITPDTLKKNVANDAAKNLLKGILGNKKKKKDTIK